MKSLQNDCWSTFVRFSLFSFFFEAFPLPCQHCNSETLWRFLLLTLNRKTEEVKQEMRPHRTRCLRGYYMTICSTLAFHHTINSGSSSSLRHLIHLSVYKYHQCRFLLRWPTNILEPRVPCPLKRRHNVSTVLTIDSREKLVWLKFGNK